MSERPRVTTLILFRHGEFAAFDSDDKQIPQLQTKSAIELWCDQAEANGYDVDRCHVHLLNGISGVIERDEHVKLVLKG